MAGRVCVRKEGLVPKLKGITVPNNCMPKKRLRSCRNRLRNSETMKWKSQLGGVGTNSSHPVNPPGDVRNLAGDLPQILVFSRFAQKSEK